ncbi:hypothetical protein Zm00014a_014291 [Zea mays]|uniref:Uncharacterized protein n=1 Tax=Zea mays TaxID=4577 RepID=A0A3L6EJ09_MAIZE|nr:hypothetical protein Zm00014a_014291 [Zea mays]
MPHLRNCWSIIYS